MVYLFGLVLYPIVDTKSRGSYTDNSMCLKAHCTNPIFPGMKDMYNLDKNTKFQCSDMHKIEPFLGFCNGVIDYHPSVKKHDKANDGFKKVVQEAEKNAITIYTFHLSAMGLDFWDYQEPDKAGSQCIKAVWKLACYTHFPRSPKECKEDEETAYVRPCAGTCTNYVAKCGVECCDESVQCVFTHTDLHDKKTIRTEGYYDEDGPSVHCTGSSAYRSGVIWILIGLLFSYSSKRITLLLGCSLALSSYQVMASDGDNKDEKEYDDQKITEYWTGLHKTGNWRKQKNYLQEYSFHPPGTAKGEFIFNSCSLGSLKPTEECSGHGFCRPWDESDITNPTRFCQCDVDWADPECRTKRKSQAVAFSLSLFIGWLGADQFYLGYPVQGAAKLISFGGFGVWWAYDIVRIGSAPIYANEFRLAQNLEHWVYVTLSVICSALLGFTCALGNVYRTNRLKRRGAIALMAESQFYSKSL